METLDDRWIWQRDYRIASKSDAGRVVVEEILSRLAQQQWHERDRFAVHLAMEEALTNAVKHGNRFDTLKHIEVTCRIAPDLLRIEITDEGRGFDPSKVPDPTAAEQLEVPCGRGIMLMRNFMSRILYNAKGNSVTMEKERSDGD